MAWNDNLDRTSVAYAIASDASNRIRVVAGPGTGKSFALKRRVAKLLEDGVNPKRILPVTFTRVAAEDLHRELQTLGVTGCNELDGRTLHSLGLFTLHTGTTDHALLDCHRCPTHVVTAAVNLIACNTNRQNRQLAGVNANGAGQMETLLAV